MYSELCYVARRYNVHYNYVHIYVPIIAFMYWTLYMQFVYVCACLYGCDCA